jgi:hypothetical protein
LTCFAVPWMVKATPHPARNDTECPRPILAQLPALEKRFQFDEIVFSRMPGKNPHPKSSVDVSAYGS